MAGGDLKYRHLSRSSAHRQALLRNLVTSLLIHESIKTTWPKAKEAQRLAEKVITLGKKNTSASRRRAESILFQPLDHLPKLFDELRLRYAKRPGGYTRVLRIEPLNKHFDQAPSAILELVDGPKDMRFAMTAKTLARERAAGGIEAEGEGEDEDEGGKMDEGIRDVTARNVRKVTRFRPKGMEALEKEVQRLELRGKDETKVEVCDFPWYNWSCFTVSFAACGVRRIACITRGTHADYNTGGIGKKGKDKMES
ncbi:MAG: hypothetical protein LQ352_003332 [Teloschistes flavicans]|nr:MAG: hypothetical protein LQ352_003332 [Teloschistes flavicans]